MESMEEEQGWASRLLVAALPPPRINYRSAIRTAVRDSHHRYCDAVWSETGRRPRGRDRQVANHQSSQEKGKPLPLLMVLPLEVRLSLVWWLDAVW